MTVASTSAENLDANLSETVSNGPRKLRIKGSRVISDEATAAAWA